MKYLKLLLIAVVAFTFNSCNKDEGLNPGGGMGGSYVITADVNGQFWGADDGFAQAMQPFGMEIRGTGGNSNQLVINISPYDGIQTYMVNGIIKATYTEGGIEYTSTTGQINVTSDTQEYMEGTFSFEMVSNSGSGALSFANGQFKVPFY